MMTRASSGPIGSMLAKGEGLPISERYSVRWGASSVTNAVDDQCMLGGARLDRVAEDCSLGGISSGLLSLCAVVVSCCLSTFNTKGKLRTTKERYTRATELPSYRRCWQKAAQRAPVQRGVLVASWGGGARSNSVAHSVAPSISAHSQQLANWRTLASTSCGRCQVHSQYIVGTYSSKCYYLFTTYCISPAPPAAAAK